MKYFFLSINITKVKSSEKYESLRKKYSSQKDTPHSELLLRNILNHKTSPSGHTGRIQKKESTNTVKPRL